MATMPSYQTPDDLTFARANTASGTERVLGIRSQEATIERAENAYVHSTHQSRLVSATCFVVAAAAAIGTTGQAATAMAWMLGMAILSALACKPIAMRQFRREIEETAKAQGHSSQDAKRLAVQLARSWVAQGGVDRHSNEALDGNAAVID